MAHRINPRALREYDVRGVVGQTLGPDDARAIGRSFATRVIRAGGKRIAVGRDGRTTSPMLEAALVEGLVASGANVVRIGVGPTPMLYYAEQALGFDGNDPPPQGGGGRRRRSEGEDARTGDRESSPSVSFAATSPWRGRNLSVDAGIQVTGSHNPPEYNGFKLVHAHRSVFGEVIRELARMAEAGDWESGEGRVEETGVLDGYVDRLAERFTGGAFRIAWDCGNGAAGPAIERLVQRLPGEHHLLFAEVDGRFPNHHPDPTVPRNLVDLQRVVAERGLDFGVAFDGDGDRIGAVDGSGRIVWGDQLLAILAESVLRAHPGATIVADVKASRTLFDRIAALGGVGVMWKSGHSLMKAKMRETGAPLGGEMSGHIFFGPADGGYDDAPLAAVRLIGAIHASGRSLAELRDALPQLISTPEMRLPVDDARKFAIVDAVLARLAEQGADVNRTDGARVTTADGWWLLRASNTEGALTLRAEAPDQAGLDRLLGEIAAQLAPEGVSIPEGSDPT